MTQPPQSTAIPYASPRPPEPERHRSMAGGVAILFAGLGLIFLGGCFLLGVMRFYAGEIGQMIGRTGLSFGDAPLSLRVLPWVLYAAAFACFGGAVWMIRAGVRWLYAVG